MSDIAQTFPLSPSESEKLYVKLHRLGARVLASATEWPSEDTDPESILATAAEQARFDYRLLYILVALMAERYSEFHPFRLRAAIRRMKSPAAWGVVFEYARKVCADEDLKAMASIVLRGIEPASPQMFFISQLSPKPEAMRKVAVRTPDEFLTWGFFSDEVPVLKELRLKDVGKTFSRERRGKIIRGLLAEQGSIQVSDYLEAVGHSISRQQAHKDLVHFPKIVAISDRRGRKYRSK